MHPEIVQADVSHAAEILTLQKLAYQSEAALYQDWSLPALTQTLDDIRVVVSTTTFLIACRSAIIVGSVRALMNGGTCAIGRLIVQPEEQGR